ncbi:MAG TPA: 2-oxoglutarate dehydrogenase complex dihydrolipoyllysine-residue succinyltransferase [Gemmataceae bacterium]|nr:2-oxoglutarate dehydrogenase complex dihydrolipoyllysine-residue succinyltransferase [Gemmataceae bacterium]
MAVDIKVPSVGESISQGTLARWLKPDGAQVRMDEPVFELETEKATTEIAAPATGVLHVTVPEGQTVDIGATVGRIEEGGAPAKSPTKSNEAGATKVAAPPAPPPAHAPAPTVASQPATDSVLSPAARRLVQENGVDAGRVHGTGRGGRVTKEDVLQYLEQKPAAEPASAAAAVPAATPAPQSKERRQRMSAIRARIAERLVQAKNTAAILTTFNEADLSGVMALRAKYKDTFQKKHGVSLGFMSFFVKASIEALKAFPVVNASIEGADIVYHDTYDIGVAVSTEKGLMVPILHDADQLSFAAIEQRIAELAQKARDGKIAVQDLQGGTFTITNGGIFGSMLSTPILNPPQSAILGMHAIQKRPIAVNDQVVIRPMMYLALSYDHRLIDGREAVQFLVRVKECLESPERLLLEV